MKFEEFLPIGSVVLLNHADKKIVIMGVMQIKHTEAAMDTLYDYMGVPYPEGFLGGETGLLFNHKDIQEVVFTGYVNEERTVFVTAIQKLMEKTEQTILEAENKT